MSFSAPRLTSNNSISVFKSLDVSSSKLVDVTVQSKTQGSTMLVASLSSAASVGISVADNVRAQSGMQLQRGDSLISLRWYFIERACIHRLHGCGDIRQVQVDDWASVVDRGR